MLSLCLLSPQVANAEEYQIGDDGYAHVPLDFVFPYQGQLFTDSYMFSNGVVGFVSPTNSFCCDAYNLSQPDPSINFSLFVLQTDLIDSGPGTFTAVGDNTSMTYSWNNIAEYGTNNLNTFSASIFSTGQVDYEYTKINLTGRSATIGYTGDTTQGEYYTYATEPAGTQVNVRSTTTMIGGVNLCESDPLYDASCPGYQEAYLQLQCSYNPLYDPQCQGYQDAYYAQQCYNNPLYDAGCPGYSEAYLQQKCSANPLYDKTCTGYAEAYYAQQCSANPLYDSGCAGYEQAYYNQQCSLDPLYDSKCAGYREAYHALQCSIDPLYATDCDGYEQAYHDQQCSVDPLYATDCDGYEQAYYNQQCSLNPLYDSGCDGYQNAYFQQQCSLNSLYSDQCEGYAEAYYAQQCSADPLYDSGCDGYEEAYAAYLLDKLCTANAQADSRCSGYVATHFVNTPSGKTMMVSVADPVSGVLAEYSMGTIEPPRPPRGGPDALEPMQERMREPMEQRGPGTRAENAKEMKAEAKAAAKEVAAAKTLEAQQKAQESVLAMLGYVPGFGAYSVAMDGGSYSDAPFYQPEALPESKSGVRNGLAQQVLHTKMTMMQYEGQ